MVSSRAKCHLPGNYHGRQVARVLSSVSLVCGLLCCLGAHSGGNYLMVDCARDLRSTLRSSNSLVGYEARQRQLSLSSERRLGEQQAEVARQSAEAYSNYTSLETSDADADVAANIRESSRQRQSAVESLFGQVAKTVVYGGATLAKFNNRLLCPLLAHESEPENEGQPTLFVFNNQLEHERAFRIYADDEITGDLVQEAQFDPSQMTLVYVHGWLGGMQNEIWLSEARNVALRQGSSDFGGGGDGNNFRPNVIVVDWSEFAHGSLYTATQNSFKVSRRLARLLEQLSLVGGLKPELMHCFGHSIGTHICGQAARQAFPVAPRAFQAPHRLRNSLPRRRFGRITALDPGGFCYEIGVKNETKYKGLRPSDALLVDAYYSNRSPFGNRHQVAHYNVRLSNGYFQRPCSVWRNAQLATEYFRAAVRFAMGNVGHNDILTCDHYFATRYAHSKPNSPSCSYVGYACDSHRSFVRGRCGQCQSVNQCYSMDFEYQRSEPSIVHAVEHLTKHSSYLNGSNELDSQLGQPPGGVPYNSRRIYYMQIGTEDQGLCSSTYRVRVKLDPKAVDVGAFKREWLTIRFLLGDRETIATIRDANSGKRTDSLQLHGPWEPLFDRNQQQAELSGLDNSTLTGLFDMVPRSGELDPITSVMVSYDNELNRGLDPLANPVLSIELDYLSAPDQRTKRMYSRSFQRNNFIVHYRHLDEKQRQQAAPN